MATRSSLAIFVLLRLGEMIVAGGGGAMTTGLRGSIPSNVSVVLPMYARQSVSRA